MLWIWVIVCLALLMVEMLLGEMSALALAIGTLGAVAAALLNLPLALQLGAWGVCSILALALLRPLLRSKLTPPSVRLNTDAFVGQQALVLDTIEPDQKGRVKIHGEIWFAMATTPIPAGSQVIIMAIDGATLHVLDADELKPLTGSLPTEAKDKQPIRENPIKEGE